MSDPLALFHPLVAEWFRRRYRDPTPVQAAAWPAIARGDHVLATAPTGSGKTLTAFLWAIDRLLSGAWPGGSVRVLYVSPLKALANDVRRNLTEPLEAIARAFRDEGLVPPQITAALRTGDTPASERRRMLRRPPEILITTPESLNLLLSTAGGRGLFGRTTTVILDEVHAVAATKRGTHLITAIERLARLAGEFQRLALSATVRPLERVARWVGGYMPVDGGYRRRPVEIVAPPSAKQLAVDVVLAGPAPGPTAADGSFPGLVTRWEDLARQVARRVAANRSTIVFANGRRLVEKVARFVNEVAGSTVVWAHHGSLSRPLREAVEEKLKAGKLSGIVATSSLELGIDVGTVDEVVLVGTPPTVASAVQRIGRSGHAVGETSRGVLHPYHPRDLLLSAVVARSVLDGAIEEIRPLAAPLDVLAQVVLSMVATESWTRDELYDFIRTSEAYHDLQRRPFELVLEMLAGRYAGTKLTALGPRIAVDAVTGAITPLPGAARLLWLAGGTIPDRGYLKLKVEGEPGRTAVLGELDEKFVWERSEGDSFSLGVQAWRIRRITHDDVFVEPFAGRAGMSPFWRAEERDLSHFLADRAGRLLEELEPVLGDPGLVARLGAEYRLDARAAAALVELLDRQRSATGALPHRHRVVVESSADSLVLVHATWGGRVNRAFALALCAALERRGLPASVVHHDLGVMIEAPDGLAATDVMALVTPDELDGLLREKLASTGFFGARFRENAGRALLLPRVRFGRRTPLWKTRERAKRLLAAVSDSRDFPIVLETWRTCLVDEMEVEALRDRLREVAGGAVPVTHARTEVPSCFAADVVWKRTNRLMYENDTPSGAGASVSADLVRQVARSGELRPRFDAAAIHDLRSRLHRVAVGYAPAPGPELVAWIEDRAVLPAGEWTELLDAIERDHGVEPARTVELVRDRVVGLAPDGAGPLVCAVAHARALGELLGLAGRAPLDASLDGSPARAGALEALRAVAAADDDETPFADPAGLLAVWLGFYGPLAASRVAATFGPALDPAGEALEALAADGRVVLDRFTEGVDHDEVCESDNLERLLRLTRARARRRLDPQPPGALAPFLAHHHGLGAAAPAGREIPGPALVDRALVPLAGCPLDVALVETQILPARVPGYRTAWLDALLAQSDWTWTGCGDRRVVFAPAPDRALFLAPGDAPPSDLDRIVPSARGRFPFADLAAHSGLSTAELTRRLWELAWSGCVTNDGFEAVRRGLAGGFEAAPAVQRPLQAARRGSSRFSRWRSSRPFPGAWYRLEQPQLPDDPVERDELVRERARAVLARHGVVFRDLVSRELPGLGWPAIVRALQLLELAGEAVAGRFFTGVAGLQFATPAAVDTLERGLDEDRVHWVCATDPASVCGLAIDGLDAPRRVDTTHVVHHGSRIVVVSTRRGRSLTFAVGPDSPDLPRYLDFLDHLLCREVQPERTIRVESINGAPAPESPYRAALAHRFVTDADDRSLRLCRRHAPGRIA